MKTETITAAQYRQMVERKSSKYHNVKTVIDGIKFDSEKEANHYCELKLLKRQGEIIDFFMQVPFLVHEGYYSDEGWVKPIYYKADFLVIKLDLPKKPFVLKNEIQVIREIHETKGKWTRTALDKKKMFQLRYQDYIFKVI